MSFRSVSAKKYAKDIADGYVNISAATLRKYQPHELKQLLMAMNTVQREIRSEIPEEGAYDKVKKKNFRLGNLSRSIMVVNHFIKHRRIKM